MQGSLQGSHWWLLGLLQPLHSTGLLCSNFELFESLLLLLLWLLSLLLLLQLWLLLAAAGCC